MEQRSQIIAPEDKATVSSNLIEPTLLRHLTEIFVIAQKFPFRLRSICIPVGSIEAIADLAYASRDQAWSGWP